MQPDEPVLEELSRAHCLRLLATVPIGRLSYTRRALPAVEPVNRPEAARGSGLTTRSHPLRTPVPAGWDYRLCQVRYPRDVMGSDGKDP